MHIQQVYIKLVQEMAAAGYKRPGMQHRDKLKKLKAKYKKFTK